MPDINEGLTVDGESVVDTASLDTDAGFERALRSAVAKTDDTNPAPEGPSKDSAADIKRALGADAPTESTDVNAGLTGGLKTPPSEPPVEPQWVRDETGKLVTDENAIRLAAYR